MQKPALGICQRLVQCMTVFQGSRRPVNPACHHYQHSPVLSHIFHNALLESFWSPGRGMIHHSCQQAAAGPAARCPTAVSGIHSPAIHIYMP